MILKSRLLALAILAVALTPLNAMAQMKSAYFAGGCFWCIEKDFEKVKGVQEVQSGYQGGEIANPTYKNHPNYIEAVKIDYDPAVIGYDQLLKIFFRSVDPTDAGGQFCDRGHAYTTAIFAKSNQEKALADAAIAEAQSQLGKAVVTPVRDYAKFWKAEEYHQNYYKKNPLRYRFYRSRCGRDKTVKELWGKQAYFGIKK